jgi:hypothetical protein
MIQLLKIDLPEKTDNLLKNLQKRVDGIVTYSEQVSQAKTLFSQYNKPQNSVFKEVRRTLTRMCAGARRCSYCEDNFADEVEHIKPKDLYPEEVFVWGNYLYACGPCNSPKQNKFAVFSQITGEMIVVTRKQDEPIVPPEKGEPIFINPRFENALDFMELDLFDTFYFVPLFPEGTNEFIRAKFTIETLRLNDRDLLAEARKEAFLSYRARLIEYVQKRHVEDTTPLVNALKRMQHPTVWFEMKRQRRFITELNDLFDQAPEALTWF